MTINDYFRKGDVKQGCQEKWRYDWVMKSPERRERDNQNPFPYGTTAHKYWDSDNWAQRLKEYARMSNPNGKPEPFDQFNILEY